MKLVFPLTSEELFMKSTYQLLNIDLVNVPIPTVIPRIVYESEAQELWDLHEDYNLFDLPICKRKVTVSSLLSSLSFSKHYAEISNLVKCKEIVIVLDYHSPSQIACKLYVKRVLQIIYLFSKRYPSIAFSIATDDEKLLYEVFLFYKTIQSNISGK